MRTFTLTNKAKADLKSIAAYTQRQWGKDQRKTYVRQFDDAFHMLSETPELGNKCNFIKQGYRKINSIVSICFFLSCCFLNRKMS
jgi:toxin ParE1/3/4